MKRVSRNWLEWSWNKLLSENQSENRAENQPINQPIEMQHVDMLIDLVISDELDPWDIDIADIANRFLQKVKEMASINLRLSGKTLLTSSILLRMKSECLVPREEAELHEDQTFDQDAEETGEVEDGFLQLQPPVRRRAERKTTLFELIDALERALGEEMIRKNFPRKTREKPKLKIKVDEQDIKEKVLKIYDQLQDMAGLHEVIKFSDIVHQRDTRTGIVETLLSLLYLDSQKKIRIWQKELFGEIFIEVR